jgi:hypothetical protein
VLGSHLRKKCAVLVEFGMRCGLGQFTRQPWLQPRQASQSCHTSANRFAKSIAVSEGIRA